MILKKTNKVYVFGFDDTIMYLDISNIFRNESVETYEILKKFPVIKKINKISDLKNKNAYAVIINGETIDDLKKFDIENRRYFKKIEKIIIVGKKINNLNHKFNKYEIFELYNTFELSEYLEDLYIQSCTTSTTNLKFHQKKLLILNDIYKYIKNKNYISSKEISEKFNISFRQVERYMLDINYLYNNIGYDYSKNVYYIVK